MHADGYQPKVSIIIPVINESVKTISCFASIRANTVTPYEIIWVDNGSNPDHFGPIKRQATRQNVHTKLVKFKKNQGFIRAINAGIKEVEDSSEYIVLLNNDTEVSSRWLAKLISPLSDPKVGAVGPITQSKIAWQEANHLNRRWNLRLPGFNHGATKHQKVAQRYAQAVNDKFGDQYINVGKLPLSFFCVAMRKGIFDELGPLDEDFGIGLGDDDEYCYRMRAHGYKLMLSLGTFVYHWHRSTFTALRMPVDKMMRRSIAKLKTKKKEITKKLERDETSDQHCSPSN